MRDLRDPAGAWTGLDFDVDAKRPRVRVEYGRPGRFRICAGDETLLLARLETWWRGVWWGRPEHTRSRALIAPLQTSDAKPRDDRAWAWRFHELLCEASVLYSGRWRIEPAPVRAASFGGYSLVRRLEACLDQRFGYSEWDRNGSGDVFALRSASPADAGRVKAWRKVARNGALPPVLVFFVSGLDSWLLLDGHDRLQAARLEGVEPTALTVSSVVEQRWTRLPEETAKVQTALAKQLEHPHSQERMEAVNRRLIALYADPSQVVPRTRAWPLRSWQHEARELVASGAPTELLAP